MGLKEQVVRLCSGCIWLRREPVVCPFEKGNKISVSINGGEFLDKLRDCLHWKEYPVSFIYLFI